MTFMIILCALLISVCVAWSVWSRARQVRRLDARTLWQDLDVDALLALTHAQDDSFLQQNLGPLAYLSLHCKRSLLAVRMCGRMLSNANVAIRLAQDAMTTDRYAAEELTREAVALRTCLLRYRMEILSNLFRAGALEGSELRHRYARVANALNAA